MINIAEKSDLDQLEQRMREEFMKQTRVLNVRIEELTARVRNLEAAGVKYGPVYPVTPPPAIHYPKWIYDTTCKATDNIPVQYDAKK